MKTLLFVNEDINNVDYTINALTDLQDEYLNGNNGDLYLWDVAKEYGCKTNLEYLVKVCEESGLKHPSQLAQLYCETWLYHDRYYTDYLVDEQDFNNGKGMAISVVVFSKD